MNRLMIVATLVAVWGASTVAHASNILFSDDFDSIGPTTVANLPTTISSGYKVDGRLSESATPTVDYTVIFGYDYGTPVAVPAPIPSAPNSTGGTTKGLFLTANKTTGSDIRAAVALYPVDGSNVPLLFSGNYSLKFDLWLNWGGSQQTASAEQALFGINHSGTSTNPIFFSARPETSDGLSFSMSANGAVPVEDIRLRDFGVYQGTGASFMDLKDSTDVGFFTHPAIPAAYPTEFDNTDPALAALFPAGSQAGIDPTQPFFAGSPAEQWVEGEVRQEDGVISWYLNGTLIARYTNTTAYTAGDIMMGYWDNVSTVGNANNYAIFDNIRVIIPEPSALALGGIAAAVLGAFVRRRKS